MVPNLGSVPLPQATLRLPSFPLRLVSHLLRHRYNPSEVIHGVWPLLSSHLRQQAFSLAGQNFLAAYFTL